MKLYRYVVSARTIIFFSGEGGRKVLERGDLFGPISEVAQDEAAVLVSEGRQEFVSPLDRLGGVSLKGHDSN